MVVGFARVCRLDLGPKQSMFARDSSSVRSPILWGRNWRDLGITHWRRARLLSRPVPVTASVPAKHREMKSCLPRNTSTGAPNLHGSPPPVP